VAGGAAIGLAWAVPAAIAGGPDYAKAIFWGQSAGRVADSFAHRAAWWYYLPLLPLVLFPWLAWPTLWRGARRLFASDRDVGMRFCTAWLVLTLVAFSLVSGKQAKYLVPMLPAFALFAARALATRGDFPRARAIALPALGFAVAAAAIAVVHFDAARFALPSWAAHIPLWPALAMAAIAVGIVAASRRSVLAQARVLAFATFAGTAVLGVGVVHAIAPYNDVTAVARRIAALQRAGTPVAFLGKYHALFNYAGRLEHPVTIIEDADLVAWVLQHPDGIVVETEHEQHQPGPEGPDFEALFRGGTITVWQGGNLLAHDLSHQL
jgi:4-amino-4-deoxy-L-arabinose transferase-like glycosyltransferase